MIKVDYKTLLTELEKHYSGSLSENQNTLQELVNILGDIIESLGDAKIQVPTWKYHIQTLLHKVIFTSNSIIHLSKGSYLTSFKDSSLKIPVIDFPSLFILTRALIENYVTFCYIYNNKLSDEERLFRYKLWEVSGLTTRQNFEDPKGDMAGQKKADEAALIMQIMSEIEQMDDFKKLEKKKLQKLKSHGLSRTESWHSLIKESNLKQPLFANTYSFFSDYAHSEYLSILQMSQTSLNANHPTAISNTMFVLSNVRMIIVLCIKYYIDSYKTAEIVFNTYPQTHRTVVDLWTKISSKSTA